MKKTVKFLALCICIVIVASCFTACGGSDPRETLVEHIREKGTPWTYDYTTYELDLGSGWEVNCYESGSLQFVRYDDVLDLKFYFYISEVGEDCSWSIHYDGSYYVLEGDIDPATFSWYSGKQLYGTTSDLSKYNPSYSWKETLNKYAALYVKDCLTALRSYLNENDVGITLEDLGFKAF